MTTAMLEPKTETRAAPAPVGTPSSAKLLILTVLGGALLWASYFPLNLGFLAWVGTIPFALLCVAPISNGRRFLFAFLMGVVFYGAGLQFLRVAHPMMAFAWIGLALYCSIYLGLTAVLTTRLLRAMPLTLALPVAWVGVELARGYLLRGFEWYFLAHSQHDYLPVIQIADITGAYGISFLMAAVGGLLTVLLLRNAAARSWVGIAAGPTRFPTISSGAVLVGALVVVGYGIYRLDTARFTDGPRVALIQGNIPQEVRNSRHTTDEQAREARGRMIREQSELMNRAFLEGPKPDLVIWPETSYPYPWHIRPDQRPARMPDAEWEAMKEAVAAAEAHFGGIGRIYRSHVLLGLNTFGCRPSGEEYKYNTALQITPEGDAAATYHKMHRVPFGEYIPFKESLPWMRHFTPYDNLDYGIEEGTEFTRFRVESGGEDYTFGVLICYEDSNSTLARRYVGGSDDPAVDFLVNISHDGWFKGTSEHELHLATCRFRAIENRRPVVRAVNMGISAVIDGDGRVVALPAETWADSKAASGIVKAVIPLDGRESVYSATGDWFAVGCGILAVVGVGVGFRSRRREFS